MSPVNMASRNSTNFLQETFDELCDRLKLLLQEKQVGIISDSLMKKLLL